MPRTANPIARQVRGWTICFLPVEMMLRANGVNLPGMAPRLQSVLQFAALCVRSTDCAPYRLQRVYTSDTLHIFRHRRRCIASVEDFRHAADLSRALRVEILRRLLNSPQRSSPHLSGGTGSRESDVRRLR